MKKWGKTTGKKAATRGYVSEFGANGIKNINPLVKGGKKYNHEIKIKQKEFESYRIYGHEAEDGTIIFDLFGKHL